MKKGVWLFPILAITLIIAACASLSENVENAKKAVEEQTAAENQLIYDNGKNFLAVDTTNSSSVSRSIFAMEIAQRWLDAHPDKRMVFSFSDGYVYIFYYEDKNGN